MKKLLLLFVALPTLAFAQDGGGGIDIDLMQIVATLIIGVGIPLAVNILKQVWPGAPGLLKTIAPLILAPLLLMAGAWLTAWLGVTINFGPIIDVITGGVALGLASSMAFKLGKGNPTGAMASVKTMVGKR